MTTQERNAPKLSPISSPFQTVGTSTAQLAQREKVSTLINIAINSMNKDGVNVHFYTFAGESSDVVKFVLELGLVSKIGRCWEKLDSKVALRKRIVSCPPRATTGGRSGSPSSKKHASGCQRKAPNNMHWQMNQSSNLPAGLKSKIVKENESAERGRRVECEGSEGSLIA
jgi:hypothetical protein